MLKVTVKVAEYGDEPGEVGGNMVKDFYFPVLPRVGEKIDLFGTGDYEPVRRVWYAFTDRESAVANIQIDVWIGQRLYENVVVNESWKLAN